MGKEFGSLIYEDIIKIKNDINISTKEIVIPTNTIESVKTNKNQILVRANGKTIAIVVSHNKEWKKQIEYVLAVLS